VDDDNGPSAGREAVADRLQIEMPAMIVEKFIGSEPNVVELRQEIEERVARLADQHFIAGIAQEAEEEAVSLAGASGEEDLPGIGCGSVVTVVEAYGLTGCAQTPGVRFVLQSRPVLEWEQSGHRVISEAAGGRVGSGQVP
jgi:hypothetical protein